MIIIYSTSISFSFATTFICWLLAITFPWCLSFFRGHAILQQKHSNLYTTINLKKKKKILNLPNNNDYHHCIRSSNSLKQTIANNILKGILTYFFQLETRRITNLNVPNINNNKYCSLYLKASKPYALEVLFFI